jgi:serine/threonine protein kinase
MFNAGDVIGPYTLRRKLGEGHFGVVWLADNAIHLAHQEVALKVLKHPDSNAILQEVFNWAKAEGHPNILPILEAKIYPTDCGDLPVIVSSYIQEGSLKSWVVQNQPLAIETAVELACGILDGVEHLHRKHIVHRDLKPDNVLMYQGSPLLTDFGIARFQLTDADVQTSLIAGTIPYMAPESFLGVRSPQVDVWAVAVMCYELLAGRRPFPSDPNAIINSTLPPLPSSVFREVRKVLEFALRKDPAMRYYKSAAELRAALLEAITTRLIPSRPKAEAAQDDAPPIPPTKDPATEPTTQNQQPESQITGGQKIMEWTADSLKAKNIRLINEEGKSDGQTTDNTHTKITVKEAEATEDFVLTNRKNP